MESALTDLNDTQELRRQILELTAQYAALAHGTKPFVAGQSPVPVAG
jgi:CDP-6-deoxy-D-xylo-4-hexulose-3-dehydrase